MDKRMTTIRSALEIAFMAGRWRGQVDLEEHMDNNFFDAFLGAIRAEKRGGQCLHSVSLDSPDSRPVKYNLRSDQWREGVKKETAKWLKEAEDELKDLLSPYNT